MVAHNAGQTPPRKAFPQVMMAFSEFHRRHPEAFLYLHTEVTGLGPEEGINLLGLAATFGIPEDSIAAVPQQRYLAGAIGKDEMAVRYSAMDVLANPSYGEGFGIPIVEAQSCGTPVVVSAWSSMPELCGAGWQVGGQPWFNTASGAMWLDPDTSEILEAFEAAYEARGDTELREKAREFAVQYDADTVMSDYWLPALEQLGRPREVAPLRVLPKRKARRAAAKTKAVAS
jgi:glycosyltransferase involved in cell wall biosynthesis